jgi:MFS transporter, BCD family, chlorophyll transporter
LRDVVSAMCAQGYLGPALADPATAYSVVYQIEVVLLFLALIAIGPLVGTSHRTSGPPPQRFGLADLPN